jgi:hypothetical protein
LFGTGRLTFLQAGRFWRVGRLRLRLEGIQEVVRLVRLVFFFVLLSVLTPSRRTRVGVEYRYRYTGEAEGRYSRELEGDFGHDTDVNVAPGWEFGNPNQNRSAATFGAPNKR